MTKPKSKKKAVEQVSLGAEEIAIETPAVETTAEEAPVVETVVEEKENTTEKESVTIKEESKTDGRKIGNDVILEVKDTELNGRFYKKISTVSGLTFLLSEKDFESQLVK